jgi:hypothetical protein
MSFRFSFRPSLVIAIAAMTVSATSVSAQTLHVDIPITGVHHDFLAIDPAVSDSLETGPINPATMDLTKFTTFEEQFQAPAGMQVVVTHDSQGAFFGGLFHNGAYGPNTGTVTLSFSGLSGAAPGSPTIFVDGGPTSPHGFFSDYFGHITSPFSFTGYTITTSNFGSPILSDPAEAYLVRGADFLQFLPAGATDTGQFVFMQSVTSSVPEPGSLAFLTGIGIVGSLRALRRLRKS